MHAALVTLLLVVGQACESCGKASCANGACASGSHIREHCRCSGPTTLTRQKPCSWCYPGNVWSHQRYPAFHGSYYHSPYNWRSAFNYPWHAEPHQPASLYPYQPEIAVEEITPPVPGAVIEEIETLDPPPEMPNLESDAMRDDPFERMNRSPKHNLRHAKRSASSRTARAGKPTDKNAAVKSR